MRVVLVHDYLTQRGGAERVVLSMLRAFPGAPLYTSLYEPDLTYPDFRAADIRPLGLNRIGALRANHRLALPVLAPAFSMLRTDADVVVCSSSGWAHGVRSSGRKIVYCHSPARWLYQHQRYLGERGDSQRRGRVALRVMERSLERWDKQAAATADRYLTNSTAVRDRIRHIYGKDADVLPPPATLETGGPCKATPGLEEGFLLCVSRLLPYKNVGALAAAFNRLKQRLVVVGDGPQRAHLVATAGPRVRFLGSVTDETLRWLYRACAGVVSASREDYGLTPVEAAKFGKPAAVLRWGGHLDTVVEGETGVFFDQPTPDAIAEAVRSLTARPWNRQRLQELADERSEGHFILRLRDVVAEEGHRRRPGRDRLPA